MNDLVRRLLMASVPLAARVERARFERRIDRFEQDQAALRARYGITPRTPIRGYDDETRARIEAWAKERPEVRLAYTSGSTSRPKALAYPPERVASFKADSRSVGVRAWGALGIRAPSIFVLSALDDDATFTSLVVHQEKEPGRIAGIVEPARYLFMPALKERIQRHGATAVRLWLMVLSDPGVIYSTNPSTLAVFLSEVHDQWEKSSAMVREWVEGRADDPRLARVARRVSARGFAERMERVARATSPPPIGEYLPGLTAYCCWDGGYVTSFLRQIHRWLPPSRYAHVPMYAMSTESIETLTWFEEDGRARFLPLGPGVLYELLPEEAEDDPARLIAPREAVAGGVYAMVVSDPYGLVRYQTGDLFRCEGHVRGVPDLRFLRRRGLTWSFTGEKLTGEQLTEVFRALDVEVPGLAALAAQMTVVPSWPAGEALPRYRLLIGHPRAVEAALPDAGALAAAFDARLSEVNPEYADKRRSGRLASPEVSILPYDTIAAALVGEGGERAWESQFKLLPLTRKTWEEIAPSCGR